ncbi:FkbM family methyltransferase [Pseudotenacibaculum haliotis]|uniref:FkbM family methyltransferase n=1 Tax=Pseudotenacibaculum haliotis TaxID=1862138 RepID=A0ABW5LRG6_9FLAO
MLKKLLRKFARFIGFVIQRFNREAEDPKLLALGAMLSKQQTMMNSKNIQDYEFKIFSQWGDDGIIQYLIKNITIENEFFIEFGVEDYLESNTRFLMMHNNWSGFVMDGSSEHINGLRKRSWYWKYDLNSKAVFIDRENINSLLSEIGCSNIGLLHIDIDGNDYHILEEIDLSKLNPSIIIMEYNSVFGKDRAISVPYRKDFVRGKAHYSHLYFGASLKALNLLAVKKGYALVGCNLAGNNAYFVRRDLLNEQVTEISVDEAYVESKFRESRDTNFNLSYLNGNKRIEIMKGLDVLNVETNQIEKL